jgi:hypothetical protein
MRTSKALIKKQKQVKRIKLDIQRKVQGHEKKINFTSRDRKRWSEVGLPRGTSEVRWFGFGFKNAVELRSVS